MLLRKTQSYLICIKQQQGFRIDYQTPQKNGLLPGRPKGTEKGKEERDGKSRQEASEENAQKVLCPAFWALQPAYKRKSPVLTELLSYQGTDSLDGLPTQQKGNKKRGYPRLDRNILSYLKKGGYLLSRFAGSTIGVSGLNFSVRNGKRWDTAAIATIISDLGIHAAQHHIEEGRDIPLTSNQQNIKKQTGMYMKKHPCEKKYRVPDKSFRAISSARL